MTNDERVSVLRFAASFLWADHQVDAPERRFLHELARELGVEDAALVEALLAAPPASEEIDPSAISSVLAPAVRDAALRAIASDGAVEEPEMDMFFVLDELLPHAPTPAIGA